MSLLRGTVARRVDFSRVMAMRTGSDFDRPAPNMNTADNLFNGQQAGLDVALNNIYLAGIQVVQGILLCFLYVASTDSLQVYSRQSFQRVGASKALNVRYIVSESLHFP